MTALILKNKEDGIAEVFDGINEIARLFNDSAIGTLSDISDLPAYLLTNYYRPVINGVTYCLSNSYTDWKGNQVFTYTQA